MSEDDITKRARNVFNSLKTNENSVFYAANSVTNLLVNRAKKSIFPRDKIFVDIYKKLKNKSLISRTKTSIPLTTPFVEEKNVSNKSTLYSFKGPFEALQADIADIRFLARSAADPLYCLVVIDLFSNTIYTYPMKKRHLLADKLALFYREIEPKRKDDEKIRLQTDPEFQQNRIKQLNDENNIIMFSSKIREGKAFAAEQAIRDLKKFY